jgi:hypothetical protein
MPVFGEKNIPLILENERDLPKFNMFRAISQKKVKATSFRGKYCHC